MITIMVGGKGNVVCCVGYIAFLKEVISPTHPSTLSFLLHATILSYNKDTSKHPKFLTLVRVVILVTLFP